MFASGPPSPRPSVVVRILAVFLLAGVYYATARLGFRATVGSPVVSTLWAPSGLALFALLRFGTWLWPAVALGAFLANVSGGVAPGGAALIAIGNTLEGLLGRFLLLRVAGFRSDLLRLRDVGALVGLAAALSPIVSATIGVASLLVSRSVQTQLGPLLWVTWWSGDAVGILVVTPLLLLWLPPRPFPEVSDRPANRRMIETFLLLVGIGLLAEVIFGRSPQPGLYVFFPLAMLIAWRLGPSGAAAGVAILALIASWFTVTGSGPLSTYPFQERLFLLQMFLAFLAISSLAFAAALAERARADAETRRQARQLQGAQALAKMGSWHWDLHGDRVTWSDELFRIFGVSGGEFSGTLQAFLDRVHPDDRGKLRTEVEGAVAERRGFHLRERIVRPDGEVRMLASVGEIQLDASGEPAAMLGTCQDVTEQWQAEAAVRAREALLRSLHRATHLFSSTLDLDRLLAMLVEQGVELTEAESGCAGLRTPAGMVARRYLQRGTWITFDYTWPPGHGLPGWVLEHRMSYLNNDAPNDQRMVAAVRDGFAVRSVLLTPILDAQGEPIGFLQIHNKKTPGGFSEGDRQLVVAVGQTAALAIQNAQAYAQLRENRARLQDLSRRLLSAHEEERRRIAREIHDELGQDLTAVKFGIENLRRHLADHPREAAMTRRAGQLGELVDATLQAMQDIVHRLRPAVLDHLGLIEALEWSGQEFVRKTGIPCKLSLPDQMEGLDSEVATAVFRVAQEALTNVVRHSQASQVQLTLATTASTLVLHVEDDGRGFDPSDLAKPGSVGVIGMRERAAAVGGVVELSPTTGGGTTVALTIPAAARRSREIEAI